ncbi:MAG: FAD/NAD(P)-binding protein [Rhodospirillales bacterium]|jgi:NAD(P)H-flavin reductase|nr:FAD/NAD(P)-binding protein [Rhodospirillales bacterium]
MSRATACLPALPNPASSVLPRPFRVVRMRRDLSDTFTLELEDAAGGGFAFAPGQFNMLYAFGAGEVAISISGNPAAPERLVHTIREVGSVTSRLAACKPGQTIGVRGPFGSAWPIAEARDYDVVIVAGGIGLAPLRPAIYRLLANRQSYGRFVILYGARTPRDILYRQQLQRWSSRLDTFVDVTVDRAASDWRGNVGVVTKLIGRGGFSPQHTLAMICGPETMIRFAIQALEDRGVAPERIYCSLERNMKCALGFCGHCQFADRFVCRDGPVFRFDTIAPVFAVREL